MPVILCDSERRNDRFLHPEKYGNATSITLPQHKIWKPPLVFANSVEKVELIRIKDSCISVTNTGIVTWMPGSSIVFSFRNSYSSDISFCYFTFVICNLVICYDSIDGRSYLYLLIAVSPHYH
jgi:hypothetical protein